MTAVSLAATAGNDCIYCSSLVDGGMGADANKFKLGSGGAGDCERELSRLRLPNSCPTLALAFPSPFFILGMTLERSAGEGYRLTVDQKRKNRHVSSIRYEIRESLIGADHQASVDTQLLPPLPRPGGGGVKRNSHRYQALPYDAEHK